MTLLQGLLLFLVAILGGTLNSVAGGGSFFTFPTLIFYWYWLYHRERDQHCSPLAWLRR